MTDDVSARLVIKQGPHLNKEYALTQNRTIIGRSPDNDIGITDPEVSRQHAQIIRQGEGFAVEDLGSTNGTHVNGVRIVGLTPLNNGDLIDLGEAVRLAFLSDQESYKSTDIQPTLPVLDPWVPAETMPPESPAPQAMIDDAYEPADLGATPVTPSSRRRWVLGCGCSFLLVVCLCGATLFFLDAYEQGRLLYCGPLQPLFEMILGPVGFSPACAMAP